MKKILPDDGFFYGLGVFTTIAVKQSQPIFLKEHLRRLQNSMAYFGMEQKIEEQEIAAFLDKNPYENHGLKIAVSPENVHLSTRENPYGKDDYTRGFTLRYSPIIRNESSPFVYHKTLNCGENIHEKRRAKAEGFDEPLFLNSLGEITEGATTNIFFMKKGGLFTPRLSCGLLNGILRQYLLNRYHVTEMAIHPNIVKEFDACFVTNSLLGIMPVRSIEEIGFSSYNAVMPLMAAYEEAYFSTRLRRVSAD